jgi:hypothetical protein
MLFNFSTVFLGVSILLSDSIYTFLDNGFPESKYFSYLAILFFLFVVGRQSATSIVGTGDNLLTNRRIDFLLMSMVLAYTIVISFFNSIASGMSQIYFTLLVLMIFQPLMYKNLNINLYVNKILAGVLIAALINAIIGLLFYYYLESYNFRGYRFGGAINNPNATALYCLYGIWVSSYFFYKKILGLGFLSIFLPLFLYIIIMTGSRAGSIILFLVFLTFLSFKMVAVIQKKKVTMTGFVLAVLTSMIVFIFKDAIFLQRVYSRIERVFHDERIDSNRFEIYKEFFNSFNDLSQYYLIFIGNGMGEFSNRFEHSAHNDLLRFLFDYGFFVVAILLLFIVLRLYKISLILKCRINSSDFFLFAIIMTSFLFGLTYTLFSDVATICIAFLATSAAIQSLSYRIKI